MISKNSAKGSEARLIFIYNADSGLFNTLGDIAHKLFSPATYNCNLCAITHHSLGMKAEWRGFLESLSVSLEFLHRDEFHQQYGFREAVLPAIFKAEAGTVVEWLSAAEINRFEKLAELKAAIANKLAGENL